MPYDRLIIAKFLTLAVALMMLLFNALRNRRRRDPRAASRVKTFSFVAIAAGVLLIIHSYNPYSLMYVTGITLVGVLIGFAVFFEVQAWRSR